MNTRRRLMLALAAGAVLPDIVRAQQTRVFRIGWLSSERGSEGASNFAAFREGLRELGYVEGHNLVIDARWGEGSSEKLQQLASDLVRSNPQVIVTQGGPGLQPVKRAGATMPVVFGYSGDPVEAGYVDSYARPGRNFTGVTFLSLELVGKRMELLKEALPALKHVAIVANPEHPGLQGELRASQAAAKKLGITIAFFDVRNDREVESALVTIHTTRSEAIVVFPDSSMARYYRRFAAFALQNHIPTVSGRAAFADNGNLLSYGPSLLNAYRRLATYVDKILKGAKPADIPVELPTSVELIVNLKTARALGITVPPSILLRADRVIE